MDERSTNKPRRKRLSQLLDWLWQGGEAPSRELELPATEAREDLPTRIGPYAITGKLGEGGMGVVYSARDERLQRAVAVKTMSSLAGDETARKRFWREARAAASVNHPNICQLYEIGEHAGELFIAMELLEGEALAERLRRGPLSVAEMLPIGLGILAALSALHARGIIHRDLKPSNVFLTPHGVKLLDFGLARTSDEAIAQGSDTASALTRPGIVLGTPRYMSPEQVRGEALDARSDLFAVGSILFEMLAGRPAFAGRSVLELLHAALNEQPPALTGSPAVTAADRVIRRALSKRSADRPDSAEAMAVELRAVQGAQGEDSPALARALMRLVVLPFRVLRPDPQMDFLAFSLPDAIATSLSRFGSLVVRSNAVAARFAGEAPDLKALAIEADVDRVVMGTLLSSGGQLRVAAQLVEAPAGTLLTSYEVLSSLGDLFRLQDDITRRVVEALALPLAGDGASPTPEAPHDAQAYGLYLRANELALAYDQFPEARELYRRCLELDPRFAPAWAKLGRCHRVIGKYIDDSNDSVALAEEALRRALELSPRHPQAHKYLANLEADTGHATRALERLLVEVGRHGNDPELFAGLVHACRYCGLFEQSVAAHREARRLDPNVPTGVAQTLLQAGDVERLLGAEDAELIQGTDEVIRVIALGLTNRREESRQLVLRMRDAAKVSAFRTWSDFLLAWLDRRAADMRTSRAAIGHLRIMDDPEAIFQEGWLYCDAGEHEWGLSLLEKSVAKGYFVVVTFANYRHFDPLRAEPRFQAVVAQAVAGREQALTVFRNGGGERFLGA